MPRIIVAGSGAGSRVLGVNRLRRTLRNLPDNVTLPVKQSIKDGAEEIRFAMLKRVPVKTGALASVIKTKVSRDGLSAKIGFFGKKDMRKAGWRARFVEFGTGPGVFKSGPRKGQSFKGIPAHPFMLPAMREKVGPIERDIDNAVDLALDLASRVRR